MKASEERRKEMIFRNGFQHKMGYENMDVWEGSISLPGSFILQIACIDWG